MTLHFNDGPIFVSLSGPAGVGKTTTANLIAPKLVRDDVHATMDTYVPVLYDHFSLAAPLHELVGVRRLTQGFDSKSRQLHGIFDIVYSILGITVDFEDLIELVYDLYDMDAGTTDDPKPRTYMQTAGDLVRKLDTDAFVNHVLRKANVLHDEAGKVADEFHNGRMPRHFVMISDARRTNEFAKLDQHNHIKIRMNASRQTLNERVMDRDGIVMTEEQWNHPTETEANGLGDDYFDFVIDTDDITSREQAIEVRRFMLECVGMAINDDNRYVELETA